MPHSDISIVANNSDSWFSADKKVDRDRDGVDDRAEGAGKGAGIGAGVERRCRLSGRPRLARDPWPWPGRCCRLAGRNCGRRGRRLPQPVASSARSRRPAFRRKMRDSYAEGVRRGGTLVSARVPDADRSRLDRSPEPSPPSTCVTAAPPGRKPDGSRSIPPASPMVPTKFAKSGSSTVDQFAKDHCAE